MTKSLPTYITKEFDEYLKCGRLEHDFFRVRCDSRHDEKLVAFSCKRGGFCPSCGARRMADSEAVGFSLHSGVATQAHEQLTASV